jgi:hypothetical protein
MAMSINRGISLEKRIKAFSAILENPSTNLECQGNQTLLYFLARRK